MSRIFRKNVMWNYASSVSNLHENNQVAAKVQNLNCEDNRKLQGVWKKSENQWCINYYQMLNPF